MKKIKQVMKRLDKVVALSWCVDQFIACLIPLLEINSANILPWEHVFSQPGMVYGGVLIRCYLKVRGQKESDCFPPPPFKCIVFHSFLCSHFPVCLLVEGSIDFRHIGVHVDDVHGRWAESIMIMVCFCVWKMRSAGDAKFNSTSSVK